jgi:hypothetical protein
VNGPRATGGVLTEALIAAVEVALPLTARKVRAIAAHLPANARQELLTLLLRGQARPPTELAQSLDAFTRRYPIPSLKVLRSSARGRSQGVRHARR